MGNSFKGKVHFRTPGTVPGTLICGAKLNRARNYTFWETAVTCKACLRAMKRKSLRSAKGC